MCSLKCPCVYRQDQEREAGMSVVLGLQLYGVRFRKGRAGTELSAFAASPDEHPGGR